jgi:hypothetical protein
VSTTPFQLKLLEQMHCGKALNAENNADTPVEVMFITRGRAPYALKTASTSRALEGMPKSVNVRENAWYISEEVAADDCDAIAAERRDGPE